MVMKLIDRAIMLLIVVNIIVSFYIALATGTGSYFCDTGSGCDTVQNSTYSELFGIKLSWIGITSFSILLAAYFLFRDKRYWIFFLMSTLGMISAIYFIYLQVFVIKALCNNCLVVDILAILIFILSVYDIHQKTAEKTAKKQETKAL